VEIKQKKPVNFGILYLRVLVPHPKFQIYLLESHTFPHPQNVHICPSRINPAGPLALFSANKLNEKNTTKEQRKANSHYNCCCCCCCCSCVLMVLLGCGQPWCMTLLIFKLLGCSNLLCMHKRWSSSTPTPSSHFSSPCHTAPPSFSANASVHHSCASEVSPQPNCETEAIFLWPANRPFVGCLLPRRSARSAFAFWLGRLPAAARLSPRLAFWNSPLRATGAGAGAAAAEAEAAWCWDKGRGGGYLSLFMTGSDPERVNFTNPAQPRRI